MQQNRTVYQPPGGRDFVDLRLLPLLPPSSSKSPKNISRLRAQLVLVWEHTHQSTQQADQYKAWKIGGHPGKFLDFWAWQRAILNKVGKWQWRWGLIESDVQEVDIEGVQVEDMEAWEEDNHSFCFLTIILQMYVENVFGRGDWSLGSIQYSLSFVFSDIIPCEELTTHTHMRSSSRSQARTNTPLTKKHYSVSIRFL